MAFAAGKIPFIRGFGNPREPGAEVFAKDGHTSTLDQSFALTRGKHSMKFGGMYRYMSGTRINEEVPVYTYETQADLLAANITSARFIFELKKFLWKRWFGGIFFQDDIRLSPKFVLNVGVRWDYASVPDSNQINGIDDNIFNRDGPFGREGASLDNQSSLFRRPDSPWDAIYNMWSPRAGFAWTIDDAGKTVIRGGAGIFFMPHNMFGGPIELISNGPDAPVELTANELLVRELGLQYGEPNEKALAGAQASGVISGGSVDPTWRAPYSIQYSFGLQRKVTDSTVFDVGYVGNRGIRTIYSPDWNRLVPNTGGLKLSDTLGLAGVFSQNFRYYQAGDSTGFHSLQTSFRKRFAEGLQFNLNYTYAWNYSHFRGDMMCCWRPENPQNLLNLAANRGPTPYHIRHRFTGDFFWEVPSGNLRGAAKQILGGWTLGGILEVRTGNTLAIGNSTSTNPGARPDILTTHGEALLGNYRGTLQYLDPAAFAAAPTDERGVNIRPGTLGRRSIYGPGFSNLDLTVQKMFAPRERHRLQFRMDFFNFFNHTNFIGIQTNQRSGIFGWVIQAADGRKVQLTFRYSF